MNGVFERDRIKVRKTYFHPLFVENSVDIEFEISEKDFETMMAWEKCSYDEDLEIWYAADDSASYEIIEWLDTWEELQMEYDRVMAQYAEDIREAEDYCAEHYGYSNGSNYELMVADIDREYAEKYPQWFDAEEK